MPRGASLSGKHHKFFPVLEKMFGKTPENVPGHCGEKVSEMFAVLGRLITHDVCAEVYKLPRQPTTAQFVSIGRRHESESTNPNI